MRYCLGQRFAADVRYCFGQRFAAFSSDSWFALKFESGLPLTYGSAHAIVLFDSGSPPSLYLSLSLSLSLFDSGLPLMHESAHAM